MKTKSLLLLILILIIGFIMGFLSSSVIRENKAREYRSYSSYESFRNHSLEKLQPSEEQKLKILPIIEEYSNKNQELKVNYRRDFRSLMKEFREELKPFLTEEQLEAMERRRSKKSSSGKGSGSNMDSKYKDDSFHSNYFCP